MSLIVGLNGLSCIFACKKDLQNLTDEVSPTTTGKPGSSNLHQESSPLSGTFPCGVVPNSLTISSTISRALPPISFTVYPAVDVACFTLEKMEDN